MTRYPHEAGEPEAFTPKSLEHLPDAPVIYLRWGTPREKEQRLRVMDEEGLSMHSVEAMRQEILKGMKALLSPEDFDVWNGEIRSFWDARDSYDKEVSDIAEDDRPEFHFDNEAMVTTVLEQIGRDWKPFLRMNADNRAFSRAAGPAINSVIITSTENMKCRPKQIGRYISFDDARTIADELDVIHRDNKVKSELLPSQELGMACMMRLYLGKERMGNSESPAPSEPTPDTSKTGAGETSGKSKGSARSKKTRAST